MRENIDLTGQRFGRLTVIRKTNLTGKSKWLCQCDCGNTKEILGYNLTSGTHTKSCGCLQKEKTMNPNKYDLNGEYGKCYLYSGEYFIFDLEDYEKIKDITWCAGRKGYISGKFNGHRVFVHRIITNCPKDLVVDHINHNVSDNRKENLRVCTVTQNNFNKRNYKNRQEKTGVYWHRNRWTVYITANKKDYYLGRYKEYEEAVKVREEAERKYFGQYANVATK